MKPLRTKINVTPALKAAVMERYPTAIDTEALAKELGLTVDQLRNLAVRLGARKTQQTRCAIATTHRWRYAKDYKHNEY